MKNSEIERDIKHLMKMIDLIEANRQSEKNILDSLKREIKEYDSDGLNLSQRTHSSC